MAPPSGRTWVDPPWHRRQHAFCLCPTWKRGNICHPACGTPPAMVGLLCLYAYSGGGSWGLSGLSAGRERRPADLGKESGETTRGKTLRAIRKTRVHHGVHRLYPAAAVPFHSRPDGRRDHAISAEKVFIGADGGAFLALLCRGLFWSHLWPANDRFLLAVLSASAVFPNSAG